MSKEVKNSEENLVKKTCRELGITQKELAERIGVPQGTLNRWASTEELPKMTNLALTLMLENKQLKDARDYILKGFSIFTQQVQPTV
jgi:transcriptional regulator with XRE-family HTH domain